MVIELDLPSSLPFEVADDNTVTVSVSVLYIVKSLKLSTIKTIILTCTFIYIFQ